MLVLHDDAEREYAYGPAQGLPDTKVGGFPQALYDEAKKDGWVVISMKKDWKRISRSSNRTTLNPPKTKPPSMKSKLNKHPSYAYQRPADIALSLCRRCSPRLSQRANRYRQRLRS